MDILAEIQHRLRHLNSEHGLQILFLVVAIYMFVEAQSWARDSKIFPQIMAGGVIVGTLLLIVQDHLPEPIQMIVSGEAAAFSRSEAEIEEQVDEIAEERDLDTTEYGRPVNPIVFTGILVTVYAVAGYLFSLLVVSPLFAAAYLIWFRKPWYFVVLLSIIAGVIAYAFTTIIIVPVDRGVLVGDLLLIGVS